MRAEDVMTTPVITVRPDTEVDMIAARLLRYRVSACPVIEEEQRLVGIVSGADLVPRSLACEGERPRWWRSLLIDAEHQAGSYIRSHARVARDVMTRDVVSVAREASLPDVDATLRRHRIRRVPVVESGVLVGILSRSDLLRGLSRARTSPRSNLDDQALHSALDEEIVAAGVRTTFLYSNVSAGVLHLWGAVESHPEWHALQLAVANVWEPARVDSRVTVLPPMVRSLLWAQ